MTKLPFATNTILTAPRVSLTVCYPNIGGPSAQVSACSMNAEIFDLNADVSNCRACWRIAADTNVPSSDSKRSIALLSAAAACAVKRIPVCPSIMVSRSRRRSPPVDRHGYRYRRAGRVRTKPQALFAAPHADQPIVQNGDLELLRLRGSLRIFKYCDENRRIGAAHLHRLRIVEIPLD